MVLIVLASFIFALLNKQEINIFSRYCVRMINIYMFKCQKSAILIQFLLLDFVQFDILVYRNSKICFVNGAQNWEFELVWDQFMEKGTCLCTCFVITYFS